MSKLNIMKIKICTFVFLSLIFITEVKAQSTLETVRKSEKVKDEITLLIKKIKKVDYLLDHHQVEKKLDTVDYFKVTDKEFRVYARFVNPLKYRVNVTDKELDDELSKASQDYVGTVIEFLTQLRTGIESAGSPKNAFVPFTYSLGGTSISITLEPKLAEMYLLVNSKEKGFLTKNISFFEALDTLDFTEARKEIYKNHDQLFSSLEAINEIGTINTVIKANKKLLGDNKKIIEKLDESYKQIQRVLKNIKANYKSVRTYVQYSIEELGKEVEAFKKEDAELRSKYEKIEKQFTYIEENKKVTDTDHFLVAGFPELKKSKRYELTLTVEKIAFNKEEKTVKVEATQKYLLHIRRFRLFTPVVASGMLYTDLTFKQYGTGDDGNGNTILTESKDKVSNLSVAAYLNMYVDNKWDLPVYFQVGFGSSTERPLFFLGGGFTLIDRINISAGGIFTWYPELNSLTVGQEVSGTSAIQDDITYRFNTTPKFYLGINFDIGKKTD